MNRKYVEDIWRLFRKKNRMTYNLKRIDARFIHKENGLADFPIISSGDGNVTAYQSHSARCAWIFDPWKDRRGWYAGFEYKGIGYEGGKIRRFAGTAWGGAYTGNAIAEHRFSKRAFDAGTFCQRPIAVYDYGKFYGKPVAVLVRTFMSPLRLSDFLFNRAFYKRYLEIRCETSREHCDSISSILGENVRKLLDTGLYHGTMGVNNITSEGEIADFEPTTGGTWEGVMENKDPFYCYIAISRVLNAGKTIFPGYEKEFNQNFADAFFDKRIELRASKPAKEIAERYCDTTIDTSKEIGKRPPAKIRKIIRMVRSAKRSAKSAMDRKIYDYVLETLTNPPE
ncbi:MAG: hypothetical protein PHF60_02895 [Candidatus ainarchaeum sp.]|nr:hypothetical protein [Candidatus ainarchaeum sp.]